MLYPIGPITTNVMIPVTAIVINGYEKNLIAFGEILSAIGST